MVTQYDIDCKTDEVARARKDVRDAIWELAEFQRILTWAETDLEELLDIQNSLP